MDGILVVDKPAGLTSHQVVEAVRRAMAGEKAGHAGTLDPAATGVLPVCVGRATRIAGCLVEHRKGYRGAVTLGVATDTEDASGRVTEVRPVPRLERNQVECIFRSFEGLIEQRPPDYSAVKYRGKPLYYWTRKGVKVERRPRRVRIYRMELLEINPGGEPQLLFEVECSRGTYVRTLASEIGRLIGCGAHLSSLKRLFVGPFILEQAVTLEEVQQAAAGGRLQSCLVPMDLALPHLAAITLPDWALDSLRHGRKISYAKIGRLDEAVTGSSPVRVYNRSGAFKALAGWSLENGMIALKTQKYLAD